MSTLADRIQKAMVVRGMTQADLARATGFSTSKIAYICNGNTKDPQFTTVIKIANALNVSLNYLAGIK